MKSLLSRLLATAGHPIRPFQRSFRNAQVHWITFSAKSWEDKGKIVGLKGLKVRNTGPHCDISYCYLVHQYYIRGAPLFRACRVCSCGKSNSRYKLIAPDDIPDERPLHGAYFG